jgi:hypothetical protein
MLDSRIGSGILHRDRVVIKIPWMYWLRYKRGKKAGNGLNDRRRKKMKVSFY